MAEQWVSMKVTAEKLHIPANWISRWASKGLVQVKPNPFDRRSRLVDLAELQERLAELNAILGIDEENSNGDKRDSEL